MKRPSVSVLIDTHNHERFIEAAIVSVLEQDFPASDREILVIDDGSTDSTPEIVRKFEPHVRYVRKENGGQASAFNVGIPQCQAEIVAFLDGDDWWGRNKLSRVMAAMAADPSVGIVGHGIISVHRDGSEQAEVLREGHLFRANTLEGAGLLRRRGAFLGTSRMTIRTELLWKIGSIPEEIFVQADEYLFTLSSVLSAVQILPDTLTYYRLHEANHFQLASGDPEKLRRKQASLSALVVGLSKRLEEIGTDPKVSRAVVEYTEASANQLRLVIDGGWPWETMKTEWSIYRITHPEASVSHRMFKFLILLAALITTPKFFYRSQRAISQNDLYRRVRQRWLPVPEMQHIQKDRRAKT